MKVLERMLLIVGLALASVTSSRASTFTFEGIYQQTQAGVNDGKYSSAVVIEIQNGSPGAPDYGYGVGNVAEAVVDIESLLHEVIEVIVGRNPEYSDHDSVWDALDFTILDGSTFEVDNWFLEFDTYSSVFNVNSYGTPSEFERYLVFRPQSFGSEIWSNYEESPNQDTLTFAIWLGNLLDFDQDGRVDPEEMIVWDGRKGGSYPNDFKPSVASPVTIPKDSGFYLHAGIGRQGGPIPLLSIRKRCELGELIESDAEGPTLLRFDTERPNRYGYFNWIYILQYSEDLETWANVADYRGTGQAVEHPISAGSSAFWRVKIANEKDYKAFNLIPDMQAVQHSVALSWEGAEEALSFEIYLSLDDTISEEDLHANVAEASYALSGLASGMTYYWQVVAVFADELKIASELATFSTQSD